MKIIYINSVEIQVDDKKFAKMIDSAKTKKDPKILIRNKSDASKLARQIDEASKVLREQQYLDALANNNKLYLNNIYASLSAKDLCQLMIKKALSYF